MSVTLVLSTFNGEKYITNQLDSIRKQSLKINEVLIFDDKSNDTTPEIINKYINDHGLQNWIFKVNEKNLGWRQNFMQGLWNAKSDYIFTCDQDDIWELNKIELMVNAMNSNPQILVLTSKFKEFYPSGKTIIQPKLFWGRLKKQPLRKSFMGIPYPGCTYCMRNSIVKTSELYWQPDFPHDSLLWRMSMFCDGLYTLNISLINMRKHPDSTFTLESIHNKNKKSKRTALDYSERTYIGLKQFIRNESVYNKDKKEKLVDKCLAWNRLRKEFYDSNNIFKGIKLLKYINYYPKYRQYIGDWIWVFKKEKINES